MNFALELKNVPFAKFTPVPLINVDHSSRHYDQFVSGQHCAGRGDGGLVLPGVGIFKHSQKNGQVSQVF